MVKERDIVCIRFTDAERQLLFELAAERMHPGRSYIRKPAGRLEFLHRDQVVGQFAEAAFHKHALKTLDIFEAHQRELNALRAQGRLHGGDGGYDVPGIPIDVKGRARRGGYQRLRFWLPITPHDRRPGWFYVLALVDIPELGYVLTEYAHLVGWARESMLPAEPAPDGKLAGSFALPATSLLPITTLVSMLRNNEVRIGG